MNACLANARTHGLTSKTAKQIFGPDISKLLYEGVRSIDFAKDLIRFRIYPSRAPFDPATSESFVNGFQVNKRNFAELAIVGGMKINESDQAWLRQNNITFQRLIKLLNNPDGWPLLDPSLDRDKLNHWWRALRKHYSAASGEFILIFINAFPIHLKGMEFVNLSELEAFLLDNNPEIRRVLYRLIAEFNIDDLPSLMAAAEKNWSINKLNTIPERELLADLDKSRKQWMSRQ